ncbi:MAG: protein kinase [Chloroflexota bacterium]
MSTTDPLIGTQMGDYTIKSLLGRGGMARVYNGYDANLDRFAAVKVIDSHLITGEDRDEYYQRFQREARAIARLRHPNIVGVYQFGQANENYYMAMVFIEGEDLRQILKRHVRNSTMMSHALILKIIRAMANALDYAHSEGVIHRDVKPSNILVTEDGNAVLTDFGLALSVPEGTIGNTFGSAHYIAPEQAVSSAQAVPQSDLYSLGICLYEMLTGRVPFDDNSAMSVALKHLSDPPPPPTSLNPDISPQVEAVIMKVLSKEPEDRYESGEEFTGALERAFAISDNEDTHNIDLVTARAEQDLRAAPISPENNSWFGPAATSAVNKSKLQSPVMPESNPTEGTSTKLKKMARRQQRNRRLTAIVSAVVVAIAIVGTGVLIFTSQRTGDDQPSTRVSSAVQTSEVSAPPILTEEATEDVPAETNTAPPTVTDAATATATVTTTPLPEPTSTDTAIPTDTPPPTATPTDPVVAILGEDFALITLRYDDETIVLYNSSAEVVDVSGITFVRERTGGEITFNSNAWRANASQPPERLPQLDCYQIWTNTQGERPMEAYCDSRHAWRAVAPSRAFWIATQDFVSFEVRRGEDVLTVCDIEDGSCEVPVPLSR